MNAKDTEQLIVNIVTITNQYSDANFLKNLSGDILSYTGVKLAAMKASLIDVKSEAQQRMLDLEVAKDKAKGAAYFKYKKEHGATAASDMKNMDEDYIKAQNEFHTAKVEFDKLRSIVADTHDLIDAIKSRVIDLQGARRDERLR